MSERDGERRRGRVVVPRNAPAGRVAALMRRGVEVIPLPGRGGRVPFAAVAKLSKTRFSTFADKVRVTLDCTVSTPPSAPATVSTTTSPAPAI